MAQEVGVIEFAADWEKSCGRWLQNSLYEDQEDIESFLIGLNNPSIPSPAYHHDTLFSKVFLPHGTVIGLERVRDWINSKKIVCKLFHRVSYEVFLYRTDFYFKGITIAFEKNTSFLNEFSLVWLPVASSYMM